MTAREKILEALSKATAPRPIHEIGVVGVSQTSISARLRELAKEGKVYSVNVPGKRFTAWLICRNEPLLPLYGAAR